MKSAYPEYSRPTADQINTIWGTGVVVLDANVLLNVFRFSEKSAKEILEVVESFGERVWLPHQAGAEFYKNMPGVISAFSEPYDTLKKAVDTAIGSFTGASGKLPASHRGHPVEIRKYNKMINDLGVAIKDVIEKDAAGAARKQHNEDALLRIETFFEGKTGDRLDPMKVLELAEIRYPAKVPPGFKDAPRIGDLTVWFEIMAHATKEGKPILLVTDDDKEDWWDKHSSLLRPELIRELRAASGQIIIGYSNEDFLKEAKDRGVAFVSDDTLTEAKTSAAAEQLRSLYKSYYSAIGEHARAKEMINSHALAMVELAKVNPEDFAEAIHSGPDQHSHLVPIEKRLAAIAARIRNLGGDPPERWTR